MTQLFLFDDEQNEPMVHKEFCGIPGLVYCYPFLTTQEQCGIMQEIDCRPWQNDLKRRVQHYGYKYDYKARRIDPSMYVGPLPDFAVSVSEKLVSIGLMDKLADQLIINEYLPGQGITAHVDCVPCFDQIIVTVSLCSTYVMELTHIDSKKVVEVPLEKGSALTLSGEARYSWKHGIRPRMADNGKRRGRRVSLTFRSVILGRNE